ncbi:MAG: GAF domain-containing protein [Chitinophagaceae bacterium]|nr:GAF domain-containing protein [Chitinophagaceae bacterium]
MVKDALRIAELEKLLAERTAELIQQGEELAVINSVQEALVKEMDMQAIYDLVGNKIQELFDAQVVGISTFELEDSTEKFQYIVEKGERFYPEPRPLGKLRLHLIETRKKIIINNREEGITWFGTEVIPGTEPIKSAVFVPLITGDKITSYVTLQNIDKENAFSESEIRLLETLANSMSTALENARLLKETEQRTAELAVINSVQEGLAKELDIQAIYDLVGNRIRELFDAQVVGIATFDHENQTENIQYLIEKGERYYPTPKPLNTLRKHLIQTKEKVVINKNFSVVAEAFGMKAVPGTQYPKSAVYVPLVIGEKVTGYTSLQNIDKENAFSDSDIRLLETLANTMGVALENARLFDETTRLLKETEQQKAELGVINSVQEGLAKELDMQAIYDLVGERIRLLFNAQAVMIVTFDHETATEHFKYIIEDGQRFYLASRPYDKLRQHLIITRQKIVINTNYEEAYDKFGLRTLPGTNPTKSSVFVPLIIGDKVNSYISLQNNEIENAFSESDVRLLETLANSMSVALENARLFDETTRLLKETEQRTAELAVINSVQEGLARELDMNAIYDLVGNKIRDVFDAQGVIIASFDHETGSEKFNYLLEKGERYYSEPRRYDKLRYQLIMTKQKILINNNAEQAFAEFGLKVVSGTGSPKSFLFVPLIVGNKVTSYVSLQNVDKENAFSDSDVRLLETLANSMSVALENARLFDETNRLLKETEQGKAELAVINSVQAGLVKEMDIQGIYNLVGDRIQKLFSAQAVIIASFDHERRLEYFNYHIEKGELSQPGPRHFDKVRQHLIETGQNILINEDVPKAVAEFGMKVVPGTEMPKSILFMPLKVADKVTGYVSLQNIDVENAFSFSDVRLLSTLSNSMSVALENARLFDETNRLLKETEQRTAELAIINSVQGGLASKLEIQSIYDLVGDKIRDVFDTQGICISLYDRKTNFIRNPYYLFNGKRIYDMEFELGKGLTSHIINSGNPLLINENAIERFKELGAVFAPSETEDTTKSWLGVPLISGGLVIGTIRLENYQRENAYSETDVSLLQTLANSMSVALENARLFDETTRLLNETEQRTAELAVINSVQEGLAKELDIQGIYELVGDRLCDLFPDTQTLVIRTFNHENAIENFHYAIEKGVRFPIDARPYNWSSKELIATHKPLDIRTNYLETAKQHGGTGVTKGQSPKSAVFVPMIVGELVKGSVSLQNVDKENAFSESDVRLLTTITNSMSVALENARLFDETNRLLKETEQRTGELAVINSVQEGLVREMDMQAIYDLVGNRICELFDTQTVLIRTFDHDKGNEIWRFVIEKGERLYSEPRPFMWANQQLINTRQPLLINEKYVETSKKYGGTGVSKGQPPKSAMFVPMLVGDIVKGSVSLQNVDRENAFTESDLRLLTTLTNSMSVALENARLFDETAVLLAESKQRAAELSTVNSISKALASQLDADDLIQMVGDQLKNLFKANIVYLAILNQKTKIISFPYQWGDNMAPLKLGEGLTSKIILTGEPLLINKEMAEHRKQLGVQLIGVESASYLGVPIPVGDENIGVLSVQSTEQESRFNENDMRLLSTIASSVGVALRNATLFEDVQQAKMEAETASKLAEKANEAKSAFLSTVSHELRTPLTSVLGFAKIIKKRLEERIFPLVDKSDAKIEKAVNQVSENLHVVISEGTRLTHLINDVLDLAKIEAGKMEFAQENVSMSEVAERAIAATTSLFDQKALKLIRKIDADLPEITGDKDKLIQVMINLISNSVKFTDEGSITCSVKVVKNEIIASIRDTGIGIAPDDFGAVFEQFKQVGGDTLTDKPKGTGLGLPICKEIVEHLGGRIWLESEVGKGSTFSFALPIEKTIVAERQLHLDDLVKQLKEQVAHSQLNIIGLASHILIVDDDDSIRSLLHQELGDAGYQIEEARNGKEALEKVRANRPDLIILDIMMPEMNGFDVAAVLKNDPQTMDIPIIVLSVVQDKARGFRIGVDRYLTKPIDTGLLFNEIGSLLEQGKSKKKVMIVDQDAGAVKTLTDVLTTKGYEVTESIEKDLVEKAIANQPDIIIINSALSGKQDIVQTLRFEKGLENVLFVVYQ